VKGWIDLPALARILVVGVLAGAGLPAVFALGLRALTVPGATTAGASPRVPPHRIAAAALCFGVVLAAVGYGVALVVRG
jgi:hypothetical protein